MTKTIIVDADEFLSVLRAIASNDVSISVPSALLQLRVIEVKTAERAGIPVLEVMVDAPDDWDGALAHIHMPPLSGESGEKP